MSSPVVNNVAPVVALKEKKPSTNLPAKFAKIMQFGFFFVQSVKDAGLLDEPAARELLERLCVFSSLDDQKAFYEGWLSSAKDSNKALRKVVAAWRKANMPPKPRAVRVKKEVDPDAPKKERKPRAKKDSTNDLINELSALTQPSDPIPEPLATLTSEVIVKKVRKTKTEPLAGGGAVKEKPQPLAGGGAVKELPQPKVTKPKAEPKPKATKTSKAKAEPKTDTVLNPSNDHDDHDHVDVQDLVVDGVTYLLDPASYNVFHHDSHEHLGSFDPIHLSIHLF
jgi:hypothetical protein